jgi:hypothetical protein
MFHMLGKEDDQTNWMQNMNRNETKHQSKHCDTNKCSEDILETQEKRIYEQAVGLNPS